MGSFKITDNDIQEKVVQDWSYPSMLYNLMKTISDNDRIIFNQSAVQQNKTIYLKRNRFNGELGIV